MNAQEETVYEEILGKKLTRNQQSLLDRIIDTTSYSSTILRGIVDRLEREGSIEAAEALSSFIVNVYAPIEACSV